MILTERQAQYNVNICSAKTASKISFKNIFPFFKNHLYFLNQKLSPDLAMFFLSDMSRRLDLLLEF